MIMDFANYNHNLNWVYREFFALASDSTLSVDDSYQNHR